MLDASKEATKCTLGLTDNRMWETRLRPALLLSNRLKAECDDIINRENRIQSRRKARNAAEEKRKDEAYDKAHSAKEHK